ncbi:DUF4978 domain-containing protein [Niabella beijingensis]|uniref:DUF4978 domain-containing protein n=1 Tax=Niabella beijingensis TaxID=2872700 RepID=UPI001CC11AF8|nr:DUF4978 domain-containing protein [Niabella beijingensis]MBZ4188874.1 DUF4978 domain-containing protein [Niabella beijingensis]
MKKFISVTAAFILVYQSGLLFSGCSNNIAQIVPPESAANNHSLTTLPQLEVSKLMTANGKTYLSVDGVPFPLFGAQIRLDALLNCDQLTLNDVENYFIKARDLGVNCVQVPVAWNMIEKTADSLDFTIVDRILYYANKYNLKLELLWFSTNMVGDSFSYLVPQYVLNDSTKRFWRNDEGWFWDYYGYQYTMILDDTWVLEKEVNAVTRLFDHIRTWDAANGEKHPVITAQIHNEPDALVRWRLTQKQLKYRDGTALTKERAWNMTLNALNEIGKAVKNSSYKVATRTNLIGGDLINPYPEATNAKPKDVFDLDGIDFIGVDSYKENLKALKNEVMAYASIPGNYALVAENKGSYGNAPSLILAAAAAGGAYNIYDLATSKYFIDHTTIPAEIDHGVYTWDLQEKWYNNQWFTDKNRRIIKGLVAASVDVARVRPEDFAAFNVSNNYSLQQKNQQIQTTGVGINCQTSTNSIGFVLDMKTYLLVYAVYDTWFQFSNGSFGTVISGRFNANGVFVQEGTATLSGTNALDAAGGVLYRIEYTSSGALQSNTVQFIGNEI